MAEYVPPFLSFIVLTNSVVADLERRYQSSPCLRGPHAIIDDSQYVNLPTHIHVLLTLCFAAIGLQYRFSSFQWVSTVPPILFVLAYKIYINRTFLPKFRYFIPTEEDLRQAKVHSERGDVRGN